MIFDEHRRTVDKQTNSSKPTAVSEPFLYNNHNTKDMQLYIPRDSFSLIVSWVYEQGRTPQHVLEWGGQGVGER